MIRLCYDYVLIMDYDNPSIWLIVVLNIRYGDANPINCTYLAVESKGFDHDLQFFCQNDDS